MANLDQYNWVDFYEEFARKLVGYKNRRTDLESIQ